MTRRARSRLLPVLLLTCLLGLSACSASPEPEDPLLGRWVTDRVETDAGLTIPVEDFLDQFGVDMSFAIEFTQEGIASYKDGYGQTLEGDYKTDLDQVLVNFEHSSMDMALVEGELFFEQLGVKMILIKMD